MDDTFTSFVDERITACSEMLRREGDEYHHWFKRRIELRQKLDESELSTENMAVLQEYLQLEFDLSAADQPAIYRLGMADGIRLLLLLDVL